MIAIAYNTWINKKNKNKSITIWDNKNYSRKLNNNWAKYSSQNMSFKL